MGVLKSALIFATLVVAFLCYNIQAALLQNSQAKGSLLNRIENLDDNGEAFSCQDDLSEETCNYVVSLGKCKSRLDTVAKACRKSCGFCEPGNPLQVSLGEQEDTRGGPTCADQFPFCTQMAGAGLQAMCCAATDMMNKTCAKTCKFCLEVSLIPPNPIQGMPGLPVPGGSASSVVTQQNPCDPTQVPTGGINTGNGKINFNGSC